MLIGIRLAICVQRFVILYSYAVVLAKAALNIYCFFYHLIFVSFTIYYGVYFDTFFQSSYIKLILLTAYDNCSKQYMFINKRINITISHALLCGLFCECLYSCHLLGIFCLWWHGLKWINSFIIMHPYKYLMFSGVVAFGSFWMCLTQAIVSLSVTQVRPC